MQVFECRQAHAAIPFQEDYIAVLHIYNVLLATYIAILSLVRGHFRYGSFLAQRR